LDPSLEVCPSSSIHTSSDEQGHFHIPRRETFRLFSIMGDSVSTWALCIADGGILYPGWKAAALGYAGPDSQLTCELTRELPHRDAGRGVCTIRRGDD
jgi:hypothetical protein